MRSVAVGALVAIATASVLVAQSPRRSSQERLKSGVELVEVDVIVTDAKGQPVRGLTADDFELREDDKPVEIRSFDAIELPEPDTLEVPRPPPAASGSVYRDNLRALEGSIYIIVLDFGTHPGKFDRVRNSVLALTEQLGPTDQVAMLSTGGQRAYQVEFTNDRTRLAKAVERLVVAPGSNVMESIPGLIERIARQLRPIPARRKVMALISEGFYWDPEKPEYQLALEAARRANLAIYPFDPKYVDSIDEMIEIESVEGATEARIKNRQSVEGLQVLAANTGGRATVRTNFLADGVRRMVAENRTYYLLRYYSPSPQDGKFHRISVRTRRPGLQVRARPGFTASKPEKRTRGSAEPSPLHLLAGAPVQTHGLEMRTAVVPIPSRAKSGSAMVVVTELRGADLAGAASLELTALAVDMRGTIRGRDDYSASVAREINGTDRWLRIVSRLEVPNGRYQLRVAARRSDDVRGGSVFVEVDVPNFSDSLAPGGLFLGSAGRAGIARADRLAGLPLVPFALLDLPQGFPLAAALPLRVAAKHANKQVQVAAQLAGPQGASREVMNAHRSAADFTGAAGGIVEIALGPGPLRPGDYRLTVTVSVKDEPPVSRELTFRIRE